MAGVNIEKYADWKGWGFSKKGELTNQEFADIDFDSINFNKINKVEDTNFIRCKISTNYLHIFQNVNIRNVLFDDLRCNRFRVSWSKSTVNNLKISGNNIKTIQVNSSFEGMNSGGHLSHEGVFLDLLDCFTEDVSIIGIHSNNVILNPQKHFYMDISDVIDSNWEYIGSPIKSKTFFIYLSKLTKNKSPYGVFSKSSLFDDKNKFAYDLAYFNELAGL